MIMPSNRSLFEISLTIVITIANFTTSTMADEAAATLQANDRLLCFGKLDAMRDLLPPKAQRRRHPMVKDLSPSAAA